METLRPFPIPYKAHRHHGIVAPIEVLRNPELGGNCENTAYMIAMLLGKQPPPFGTRASNLIESDIFSSPVDLDQVQTGDIIGQQKPDRNNFWGTHLSVAAVVDSRIYVVHNASHIGYLTIQTLEEALTTHPTHTRLAAIRRLPPNPETYNAQTLTDLGLDFML